VRLLVTSQLLMPRSCGAHNSAEYTACARARGISVCNATGSEARLGSHCVVCAGCATPLPAGVPVLCALQTLTDPSRRAAYDALVGFSALSVNPFVDTAAEKDQVCCTSVSNLIVWLLRSGDFRPLSKPQCTSCLLCHNLSACC
jgi:hypothetical protein